MADAERPPTKEEIIRRLSDEQRRMIEDEIRYGSVGRVTKINPPPGPAPIQRATPAGSLPPQRYYDYDEFRRDTGVDDVLRLVSLDHVSMTVIIENYATHKLYRITTTQCIQEGMGGYCQDDVFTLRSGKCPPPADSLGKHPAIPYHDLPESRNVHVLYQGQTLCGITSRPVDWPKNEEWVSYDHFKNVPEGELTGVTCERCGIAASQMRRSGT